MLAFALILVHHECALRHKCLKDCATAACWKRSAYYHLYRTPPVSAPATQYDGALGTALIVMIDGRHGESTLGGSWMLRTGRTYTLTTRLIWNKRHAMDSMDPEAPGHCCVTEVSARSAFTHAATAPRFLNQTPPTLVEIHALAMWQSYCGFWPKATRRCSSRTLSLLHGRATATTA